MKSIPFITCFIGTLMLLGGPDKGLAQLPAPPSDSAKDRAKWRLTTLSAAREILDELKQPAAFNPEDRAVFIEKLNAAMREDPQAHASRAASQRLCLELARRMRQADLERRFREVTARANDQSPIPVRWTDVAAQLGTGWSNTLQQTLDRFVAHEQQSLFTDARARAVGLRRLELEQQLRFPFERELNLMLDDILREHPGTLLLSEEDETRLQQKLLTLADPDNRPSFEELKHVMNDPTRRISSEIRRQYERQRAGLENAAATGVPADRRQAAPISVVLLDLIESELAAERAKPPTHDTSGKPVPLYSLLTPIRESVPRMAARVESDRFTGFLTHTPLLTLQSDALAKSIRSAPEKHHTPTSSAAVFRALLTPALQAKAAEAYAAGATPAGAAGYFASLLSTNTDLSKALQARLYNELQQRLPEARRTVGDEQFQKHFEALTATSMLTEEALATLQDSGGAPLTSLADSLKLFGLSLRNSDALLEETVTRVLSVANQKAKEGYEVLTTQLMLVRKLEQERLAKLREEVAVRRPYKAIRADWQSALEAAWRGDSRSETTSYKSLLEMTLATLNKTIRQLYDSIQENPNPASATPAETSPATELEKGRIKEVRQNPAKPEEQQPESPKEVKPPAPQVSSKAGGSEGAADAVLSRTRVDRRNEPDGILLLTGKAAGPTTARLLDQTGTSTCRVTFDPGNPQTAAGAIFEALQPELKRLWENVLRTWQKEHGGFGILKRRTPPKLKLFIVIESEDVRHRMSLLLRQRIEAALAEWTQKEKGGTPGAELDWKVGLTFEPPAGQSQP